MARPTSRATRRRPRARCDPRHATRRATAVWSRAADDAVERTAARPRWGSSLRVSVERRSGSAHELIRIDDQDPVSVSNQVLDGARCRSRADLNHEVGVPGAPGIRHSPRAAHRPKAHHRAQSPTARVATSPESGSASSGQPRSAHSSTETFGLTRRRPATTTIRMARTHLAKECGHPAR